jgi:hypothetical protein
MPRPEAHRQPPAASQAVQVDQHPTSFSRGRPSTSSSPATRGRSRTTITIWSRSSPSANRRRLCRRRGGGHGQGPAGRGSADVRRSIRDPFDGPGPDSCCTWQVDGGSLGDGRYSQRSRGTRFAEPNFRSGPHVAGRRHDVAASWPTNPPDVFLDQVPLAGAAAPWAADPSQSQGRSFKNLVKIGGTWSLPPPTAQGSSIRSGSAGLGASTSSSSVNSIMGSFSASSGSGNVYHGQALDVSLQAEAERQCDSLQLDTFAILTTIENESFSAGPSGNLPK